MSATMIRGLLAVGIAGVGVLGLIGPGNEAGEASFGAPGTANTIYVAPDGSDTGSGSVDDPYASFQQAVDALGPDGGTVLARGGTYQDQRILLQRRDHVTIAAYPGEQPVLDASGLVPPDGGTGVVEIRNGTDLVVRGLEITGYRTHSQDKVPIGIYVQGATNGVVLAHNRVHHLGNDNRERGSYDINAHGIAVYGSKAHHAVKGLRIVANEVDHLVLGASESVVVNGNVKGWRIARNHIHDNNNIGIDAIGFEGTIQGPKRWTHVNRARQGVVAHNLVTDIVSRGNPSYWEDPGWCNCADGIYVDGGKDIEIRDNVVRRSDIGIEAASEWSRGGTQQIRIVNNDVAGSAYVGLALGGYAPERGEAHDLVVRRNTFRNDNTLDDGSPEILIQFKVYDTRIEHNVVIATNPGDPVLVQRVRRAGTHAQNVRVRLDHNDYWVPGRPGTALFRDAGRQYRGLRDWRHGTGQDRHSTVSTALDRSASW